MLPYRNGPSGMRALLLAFSLVAACTSSEPHNADPAKIGDNAASLDAAITAATAPSNSGISVPVAVESACAQICNRSQQIHCANTTDCGQNCVAMAVLTPCGQEMQRFYHCLVGQPLANWECAEDGVGAVKQGFCDDEQRQAVDCMQAKMKP
jgi:hypothetical protein